MKKFLLFALMGLVLMGSFTSCKKDKQEKEFQEKIVGKWKTYSADGELRVTDQKAVWEFFADGTVAITRLEDNYWVCSRAYTYRIEGDQLTTLQDGIVASTATIKSITDTYFTRTNLSHPALSNFKEHVLERVTVDYKQAFVGLWEGVSMTGDETYGDINHRWQYNADGTYEYLTKNAAGQWESDSTNTGNIYYVDGDFYGSRWYKNGEEHKEWWDIDYCNDTEMKWSALREKADGSHFTTTMTMKRVVEN